MRNCEALVLLRDRVPKSTSARDRRTAHDRGLVSPYGGEVKRSWEDSPDTSVLLMSRRTADGHSVYPRHEKRTFAPIDVRIVPIASRARRSSFMAWGPSRLSRSEAV